MCNLFYFVSCVVLLISGDKKSLKYQRHLGAHENKQLKGLELKCGLK